MNKTKTVTPIEWDDLIDTSKYKINMVRDEIKRYRICDCNEAQR